MNSPLIISVSGPDGAGKSTLVRELLAVLRQRDVNANSVYLYGCIVCRRWGQALKTRAGGERREFGHSRWWRAVTTAHGVLDALELLLRLTLRVLWKSPHVVVTDRGPLDGLAKHNPGKGSVVAALLLTAARHCDRTYLLDAPAPVLAARDGEHDAGELEWWRARYEYWRTRIPACTVVDNELGPPDQTVRVLADHLSSLLPER